MGDATIMVLTQHDLKEKSTEILKEFPRLPRQRGLSREKLVPSIEERGIYNGN